MNDLVEEKRRRHQGVPGGVPVGDVVERRFYSDIRFGGLEANTKNCRSILRFGPGNRRSENPTMNIDPSFSEMSQKKVNMEARHRIPRFVKSVDIRFEAWSQLSGNGEEVKTNHRAGQVPRGSWRDDMRARELGAWHL